MKKSTHPSSRLSRTVTGVLFAASLLATLQRAAAADTPALLDDCSAAEASSSGAPRVLVDDVGLGSKSHATQVAAKGIVTVNGTLEPGRGVPAFVSLVFLLAPDGSPRDLSAYTGVRVRLKPGVVMLSLQAASPDVVNFDYHSSPIAAKAGDFQEVRLPFSAMRRAWSEQTPLKLETITSINIVAFGMAKGDFSYEVDEIGFY